MLIYSYPFNYEIKLYHWQLCKVDLGQGHIYPDPDRIVVIPLKHVYVNAHSYLTVSNQYIQCTIYILYCHLINVYINVIYLYD